MSEQYLNEKLNEFKEAFEMFDRDKDGYVNFSEFGNILRSLGFIYSDQEMIEILGESDLKADSKINFETFHDLMTKQFSQADAEEELVESFKTFDKNGRGLIPIAEFKHIMQTHGEKLSEEEVNEMIHQADPNETGMINYREFAKMILSK